METCPVILGTAGHIDHGKTALVRALTGIDTDRLKEEQQRGITIELGFAHLDIDGRRFGVIDVPGHERFIKTMAAGAAGIDVVMLVIAADEGVMPQTREHLAICELLGVRRGLVVLSKRDVVDEAWLELVTADVANAVRGTFLERAPIAAVSTRTGLGLDGLRRQLADLAEKVEVRSADGPLRLPVDRVFTMKGFGTVVTGTLLGGRLQVGDEVTLLPTGRGAKVRGLQVHGQPVTAARAGMRCAVNLGGVDHDEVQRGAMLTHAAALEPSHLIDVRFRCLSNAKTPLPRRSRILVHHGTVQLLAQLILAKHDELMPGDTALAQLHLERPLAALPGDRFIARGFIRLADHGTTLGGGEVVRVHAPKLRRASESAAAALQALVTASLVERLALEVRSTGAAGMSRTTIGARLGLAPAQLDAALAELTAAGELLVGGDLYLHGAIAARLEEQLLAELTRYHAEQPQKDGLARAELASRLPRSLSPRLFEVLLAVLASRGVLVAERDQVRLARHRSTSDGLLVEALITQLERAGLETPGLAELATLLGQPATALRPALDAAVRSGRIVRVRADYLVARGLIDALRAKLRAHLAAHGQITPSEWKGLTGVSRKYSIPLAEYFDAEKVTLRVGDVRKTRG